MKRMTQQTSDLIGQRQNRIAKIRQMRELGLDPYPTKSARTHGTDEIIKNYDELEGQEVTVAGRLMAWREHGELIFGDLQDNFGKIQLYIQLQNLGEFSVDSQNLGQEHLDLIDLGDYIEARGTVTKTKRGQISVAPVEIRILTKSVRPLPNKWTGITDTELRYRRRYLDMTMNPEIRQMFERRSAFWENIREFLNKRGFVEVNTPVLEHTTGGADARPFTTHINALDEDLYLRISQELPLKRLLGGGFEKVYDIGPRFRNEGFSDEHLPEHIALEWYWAYADYRDGMELTEEMFRTVLEATFGTLKFNVRGFEIDLEKEWEVWDYTELIKQRTGADIFNDTPERMLEILEKAGGELEGNLSRPRVVDALWKTIRPTLGGPGFLVDVPKFVSPLAKSKKDNPELTERFHPIIAGTEMANAFTELNDPQDQLDRFMEQQKLRDAGDEEAQMLDIDFVEMLEYGMPPAVGFGLTERVFWVFQGVTAREGTPFPLTRYHLSESTRKIYPEALKYLEKGDK